ncbi:MAG: hypothetical protein JSS74_12645, partial [Actinobacteria bacterium]|nr:hypothetical protein [Actinomycetota bacterium]
MTRIAPMTWWRAGLNLAGALAVVWTLWRVAPGVEGWVVALVALGIAAWLVRAGLGLLLGSAATGIPAPPRPPVADGEAPIAFESGAMRALAAGLVVVMAAAGAITAV